MTIYVGEDKIIPNTKRVDVAFHAQRALAELSFDTLKSVKAQEIIVPSTLQMILPIDYVNYTKVSWVDSAGIKHLMYPTSKTSNPSGTGLGDVQSGVPLQNADGEFKLEAVGTFTDGSKEVVLDGDYDNIVTGMHARVMAVGDTNTAYVDYIVKHVVTVSGITTVTFTSSWGHDSNDRAIQFKLRSSISNSSILSNKMSLIPKTKKTVFYS